MIKKGAPIKKDKMDKVIKLRNKGLSFREIAKLMDSDVKTVYRWWKYSVGSFPQA